MNKQTALDSRLLPREPTVAELRMASVESWNATSRTPGWDNMTMLCAMAIDLRAPLLL